MQALIGNLKQERELRQAQFEYYREKLLRFNPLGFKDLHHDD